MRSFKVLVLLTLLAAVPILAAEEPTRVAANPLATMHITPDAVSWEAEAGLGDLELAVAGPDGAVVRHEFAAGKPPTLNLFDERGDRLADGVYTYELRTARELRPGRSLLVSGSILVRDAGFVDPAAGRPVGPVGERPDRGGGLRPVTEAIVDDGACFGADCVTGDEGNPLRLKDTYLRIDFADTGGVSSPTRDWAIEINTIAGGQERFSIVDMGTDFDFFSTPFTISSGAPDHSLYVNSSGNIGLGTLAPGAKLHLYGTATSDIFGSAGPDPTNGPAFNFGYGGASFGRGAAYLNVRPDASATAPNPSLRFLTANAQRVIIDNEGNIGFGSNVAGFNPAFPLVHQSTNARLEGGIWTNGSSRAIKHDIHALEASEAMAAFAQLEPVRYRANASPDEVVLGFIAEDVPELVAYNDRKSLSPMEMVAVLTKVVQEQQKTITELAAKIEELKEKK